MVTGWNEWKRNTERKFIEIYGSYFLRHLKTIGKLKLHEVAALNKSYEIWQRDSLGIEIYDNEIAKQKLNYIHFNLPAGSRSGKWQMAIVKK